MNSYIKLLIFFAFGNLVLKFVDKKNNEIILIINEVCFQGILCCMHIEVVEIQDAQKASI